MLLFLVSLVEDYISGTTLNNKGISCVSESPRFHIHRGKLNEARVILSRVYEKASASQIEDEISRIEETLRREQENILHLALTSGHVQSLVDLLWRDVATRRALVVACGLQFFQQAASFPSLNA